MPNLSRNAGGTTHLLARLLDEPELATIVRSLDAPSLVDLVRHVGLEDAGEIVGLATTEQLEAVFDHDLWGSPRPGADEAFDPLRFGLWLEVLLDAGEAAAIERLAAMDEDFLALAIAHHVRVLDLDALAHQMRKLDEDEQTQLDKALEEQPYEEIEELRIIARDARTWESVAALLIGLDRDHHALLRRLLERVAAATSEEIDDEGGLYEVLTSGEMLESDVAGAREDRREREGYVAPSQAAAFLRLCLVTPLAELFDATERDPVQRAAARAAAPAATPPPRPLAARAQRFMRALPADSRRAATSSSGATQAALRELREREPRAYGARLEELAFLVNVVVAACGGDRSLHPVDATEIALAVCDVGLAALAEHLGVDASGVLEKREVGHLFRVGYRLRGVDPWSRATFERFLATDTEARRRVNGRTSPRSPSPAPPSRGRSARSAGTPRAPRRRA